MPPQATYRIYGLRVRSDLPLPARPVSDDGKVDLIVRHRGAILRSIAPRPPVMTLDWRQVEQGWLLHYHTRMGEVLEFAFNPEASRIEIRSTMPETMEDIVAVLVGAGLAAALHLRGVPVLHAAAVVVDGKAILVAGPAGAGKSTQTAALVRQGTPLLAEDLAVLKIGEDDILVQPGYPRLRLCPEAMSVAGRVASDLPRVFSPLVPDDKRWLDAADLAGGFCATPAPLGAIYLLAPRSADRPAAKIEPLPSHRAGLALLEHLYGARWLRIPPAKAIEWCARIAGRTPVRWVHAPPELERVRETAEAIIADAQRGACPGLGALQYNSLNHSPVRQAHPSTGLRRAQSSRSG